MGAAEVRAGGGVTRASGGKGCARGRVPGAGRSHVGMPWYPQRQAGAACRSIQC